MAVDMSSLESALAAWETIEYIAVLIVILGVVGEFVAEFTSWYSTDHARNHSLGRLSTLALIAGLAIELVCLVQTNRLSGSVIAQLHLDTANANVRAAQANERAEVAILETVTLRADRRLTPEQRATIAAALKPVVRPGLTVWIRSDRGAEEPARFGDDLVIALGLAGVKTENIQVRRDGYQSLTRSIEVQCGDDDTDKKFSSALVEVLGNVGHDVTPLYEGGCGGPTTVLIGPKPAPRPTP